MINSAAETTGSSGDIVKEMETRKVVYTAEFIPDEERGNLLKAFSPKHDNIYATHITISFKPANGIQGIELGREKELQIIGIVEDERGQAVLVQGSKSAKDHPHITISCAPGTEPKYSNEMIAEAVKNGSVKYFEEPYPIKVIEGYSTGGDTKITS